MQTLARHSGLTGPSDSPGRLHPLEEGILSSILVIDDESTSRAILREILEEAGHQISEAADGSKGIRAYEENRPDVVIADLFMPPKGGLDVIRKLKSSSPNVKIIAISGVDARHELETVSDAIRQGASRALNKPVEPEELKLVVAELVA